jgi:putative transposase
MLGQFTRWYGEQAHDGLRGRKPLAVLEAGRGPGVDVADLNWQFLWRKKVTPDRCRVRLYGIEYESDCLHGWGEPVYAMHDMNNLNSIYIYSMSGDFLGEAAPVEAMSPLAKLFADQVSVDRVQAEIARQRRLTKQTKQNLIELGATADEVESLKGLPWCQRAEITEDREQKTDDSRQRPGPIKLLRGREDDLLVVDEPDQQPEDSGRNTENSGGDPAIAADERPLFGNDTERYFWACEQIIARTRISDRDLEFVGEYEADHANRVSVSLMRAKMEAASMGGRDGI